MTTVKIATVVVQRRSSGITTLRADALGLETELLTLINAYRMQQCRPPLQASEPLTHAARSHSEAMSRQGFFAHQDTAGHGPADRVAAAGYGPYTVVGENIAMGTQTPAETLQAWIASPGHRALLLEQGITEAGVGLAERNGTVYWTLNCGRPG